MTQVIVITHLGCSEFIVPTREEGRTINRYIRPRGVIIVLLPVARWLTSVVNHNDVKKQLMDSRSNLATCS